MTNHSSQNGRFMDFVSNNTTRRTKPTSVTSSRMPLVSSTAKPSTKSTRTSTTVSRFSTYTVISSRPTSMNPNSAMGRTSANSVHKSTISSMRRGLAPHVKPTPSTPRSIITANSARTRQSNTVSSKPSVESVPKIEKPSSSPKVSFINIDKIDKRPLSSHAPTEPRKNLYDKKIATTQSEKVSTTIVSTPSRGNSLSLAIAIFFTITLGIALGIVAYFALTQR